MEKITKTFIEYLENGRELQVEEVENINPEEVDVEEKRITTFKYFEQSFIKDGEETFIGQKKYCSPTYYVGDRMTVEEAIPLCPKDSMIRDAFERLAVKEPGASVCKTNIGYLMSMDKDGITLKEYINSKQDVHKL